MNILPYKIVLLHSKDCHQCRYVIEKLKKYGVLDYISLVEQNDELFNKYKSKYNINNVPFVIIFLNNNIISSRLLNKLEDIEWLVDNFC